MRNTVVTMTPRRTRIERIPDDVNASPASGRMDERYRGSRAGGEYTRQACSGRSAFSVAHARRSISTYMKEHEPRRDGQMAICASAQCPHGFGCTASAAAFYVTGAFASRRWRTGALPHHRAG